MEKLGVLRLASCTFLAALVVTGSGSCGDEAAPPHAGNANSRASTSDGGAPPRPAAQSSPPDAGEGAERDAAVKPEQDAGEASDPFDPRVTLLAGLASGCDVRPSGFEACGGSLLGRWSFEGYCYASKLGIVYEHPAERASACEWESTHVYPASVPTALSIESVDVWPMEGTVTFDESTVQRSAAVAAVPLVSKFSESCEVLSCQQYGELLGGGSFRCTGRGTCTCEFSLPLSLPALESGYSVNGAVLEVEGESPVEFCVSESVLRILEGDGSDLRVAVYHRSP